ncbi:DUF2993 domain-containing protein [Streptomyces fructofermentans]|uniref:DUF2993 domain-containing protein n=1 Tax=Streptomyces fructofermentans TaxID=152141 RepID=UPI00378797AE
MIRGVRRLSARGKAGSAAVAVLAGLLFLGTAAELVARGLLNGRLAAAAERTLGEGSRVRIEGGPAVLDLFDRHLDALTFSSEHAALGPLTDVSVKARLDDVRLTGSPNGTVARTRVDVRVPAESLRTLLAASSERLPVSAVRLDGEAGTLTLSLGQRGLGEVTLRPRLKDGRVTMTLEHAEVLGGPAPARLVEQVEKGLSERSRSAADYPLDMRATSVEVTDSGLDVKLSGGPAALPAPKDDA